MNRLRELWRTCFGAWMRFAHVLGVINTTVLLTIVYIVVVLPMRGIWWALRKDPLVIRGTPFDSMWRSREQDEPTLEERRHPF